MDSSHITQGSFLLSVQHQLPDSHGDNNDDNTDMSPKSPSPIRIWSVLILTLVAPMALGVFLQGFAEIQLVSLPLHASLEATGALAGLLSAFVLLMANVPSKQLDVYQKLAFALIVTGVFDFFHSLMSPGELFVWLHTLAVFSGGIVLSLVFFPKVQLSSFNYFFVPGLIFLLAVLVAWSSISSPGWVPQMFVEQQAFSDFAKIMNMIGGGFYLLTALFFIQRYLHSGEQIDLMLVAQNLLFASAGILFFFSTLWDLTWWLWHLLCWVALLVVLGFLAKKLLDYFVKKNRQVRRQAVELVTQQEKLHWLEFTTQSLNQSVLQCQLNSKGQIIEISPSWRRLTGRSKSEFVGKVFWEVFREYLPESHTYAHHTNSSWPLAQGIDKEFVKGREADEMQQKVVVLNDQNQQERFVRLSPVSSLAFTRNDPELPGAKVFAKAVPAIWLVGMEITQFIQDQLQLRTSFYVDYLTQLPNRVRLNQDIHYRQFAHIALINIDNFKAINDFYGVDFGDEVIKRFAQTLLDKMSEKDMKIYRNHGDEFAILTSFKTPYEVFETQLHRLSDFIESTAFVVEDVNLDLQISIGTVEANSSLAKADIALKESKQFRHKLVKYHENLEVEQQFQKNIYWSYRIKSALKEDRIDIALQPMYDNQLFVVSKVEGLVRLIDETGQVISPAEFLEVAKRTRLYPQITMRVIKKTFMAFEVVDSPISINLSVEDILNHDTKTYLLNLLAQSRHANRLIIELVESDGIENFDPIKAFIDEVKRYGVRIAIDDFGTGYSNFEYLFKLKADFIKIDGSLIQNIDQDENLYKIVETMVSFAHKANLAVVAEFVSTESIQNKVTQLGIDFSQGYWIGRPYLLSELAKPES